MDQHKALTTREVDADSLPKVYPILEAVCGREAAAEWLRYLCERAAAHDGDGTGAEHGILAVEDHKGYVLGLFCYGVIPDSPHGRTFDCEKFIVPDLLRSGLPFALLIDEAERLARLYDCRYLSISIVTTEPRGGLPETMRDHLSDEAFAFDSVRYSKTLAPKQVSDEVRPVDAPQTDEGGRQ